MIPRVELFLGGQKLNCQINSLAISKGMTYESGELEVSFYATPNIKDLLFSNDDLLLNNFLTVRVDGADIHDYIIDDVTYTFSQDQLALTLRARDITNMLKFDEIEREYFVVGAGRLVKFLAENADNQYDTSNVATNDFYYEQEKVIDGSVWTLPNGETLKDYGVSFKVKTGGNFDIYIRGGYRIHCDYSNSKLKCEFYRGKDRLIFKQVFEYFDISNWHWYKLVCDDSIIKMWIEYPDGEYTEVFYIKDDTYQQGTVKIDASSTTLNLQHLEVVEKGYLIEYIQFKGNLFEALQQICEYMYVQLDKPYEFWIEKPNKLHFKIRGYNQAPIILQERRNILGFSLKKDVGKVYNKIIVHGATSSETIPSDQDWTEGNSTVYAIGFQEDEVNYGGFLECWDNSGTKKCGCYSVWFNGGGGGGEQHPRLMFKFPQQLSKEADGINSIYSQIYVCHISPYPASTLEIQLYSDNIEWISQRNHGTEHRIGYQEKLAMRFKSKDTKIDHICIFISDNEWDGVDSFNVSIQGDNNGEPDGNKIWNQSYSNSDGVPCGQYIWYNQNISISNNTYYWLVVEHTDSGTTYGLKLGAETQNTLGDDHYMKKWDGNNWTLVNNGNDEMTFQILFRKPENYYKTTISLQEASRWYELNKLLEDYQWTKVGNPDWNNLRGLYLFVNGMHSCIGLDCLYFSKGIQKIKVIKEDASILSKFKRTKKIIDDKIQKLSRAIGVAESTFKLTKKPKWAGTLVCKGDINLEGGKRIRIILPTLGIDEEYIITKSTTRLDPNTGFLTSIELGFPEKPFTTEMAQLSKDVEETKVRIAEIESLLKELI